MYFSLLYSLSVTACSHTVAPLLVFVPMAMWLNSLSGAAPSKCGILNYGQTVIAVTYQSYS